MSNLSSEFISYKQHHSTLALINILIARSQLEKENTIINQLAIKHFREIERIKENLPDTPVIHESDEETITEFFKQEKKIVKYLKLTHALEETKEKFNTSKYKHYLIELHAYYRKIKKSIKEMEKETPCIQSNAKIYHSMKNHKLKELKIIK